MNNQKKRENMITKTKKQPENAQASNRILIGTSIEGTITSNGDFRIDGEVTGDIRVEGKVVIGEKGRVDGNIYCANASISGALKGTAQVKEQLSLLETCKVNAEIIAARLEVQPGAEFTGNCKMGAKMRELKDGEQAKETGSKSEKSA